MTTSKMKGKHNKLQRDFGREAQAVTSSSWPKLKAVVILSAAAWGAKDPNRWSVPDPRVEILRRETHRASG
jgi:hypothetical protein